MTLHLIRAVAVSLVIASAALSQHHARYEATLSGAAQSPANNSQGVGTVRLLVNLDSATMDLEVDFDGLTGLATNASIRAPTPTVGGGVAEIASRVPTFPDFPTETTNGVYVETFDMLQPSNFSPAFLAANFGSVGNSLSALIKSLNAGRGYFNIESTAFPGGEIRGFFHNAPGDYNSDGIVDASDYVEWRNMLNRTGEGLAADGNDDNVVNTQDYMIWRKEFGKGVLLPHGGAGSGAAVPEPAGLVMLLGWLALPVRFAIWRA